MLLLFCAHTSSANLALQSMSAAQQMSNSSDVIAATEAFVQAELANNDAV